MIKKNFLPSLTLRQILMWLVVYALFLTGSEFAYRHIFELPELEKWGETFAIMLLFLALLFFSRTRISRAVIVVFFFASMLSNNIHYAVYQSWITGMNYYLMFAEMREVSAAGSSMMMKLLPHIAWAVVETAFFASILFLKGMKRSKRPIADGIFMVLILFIIVRSFSTGHSQGVSPDSGYSRLKAHYFSFGYFIGRILPYQWFNLSKVPAYTSSEPQKVSPPKIRNIILIMGESESAKHIQYFGYPRDTSPFFNQLVQAQPQAIIRPMYSAGKMTFVSLPMFFNAIPRPNGFVQINQGTSNIFRLAQQQGFETHFHSAQPETEMELMNLIGKKYLSQLTYPTELGYDKKTGMNDNLLLPYLQKTDLSQGNKLIVLHQRGSHMPYAHYLSEQEKFFKNNDNLDKYDSTVRHTNLFIQKVYEHLQQQAQQDWLLIYTSDHGQYVTDKIANQGTNDEAAYSVPLLIYTPNAALQQQARDVFTSCDHLFHQQLSEFMLQTLGYAVQPATACVSGVVTNNSLTGDVGWIEIDAQNNKQEKLP